MKFIRGPLDKAIAALATLNGKGLALLIASSFVATSGIVASAMGRDGGIGPLAEAAAQQLLEEHPAAAPVAAVPEEAPKPTDSQAAGPAGPVTAGDPPPPATTQEGVPPIAPPAGEEEAEEPAAPAAEPEASEAGPVQHVFLISLASPGYEAAFGATSQMPYLSATLRPQGVLLTNYSLLGEAALANGFAAISGQKPTAASETGCPDYEKCLFPVETLTLADQLGSGRFTWHAYIEGMVNAEGKPGNCIHPEPDATAAAPAPGAYSATANPFVYFHSLLDLGDCAASDVPAIELPKDLKKADKTANFSYIAPSLCNAGFRGQCPEGNAEGAAAADAWLEKAVPEILSSPAYKKDGLLIVSFGAASPDPAAPPATDPLKVGALLISPLLPGGGTDAVAYSPYSLLRSTEDLFGLAPLGEAGGARVHSFASAFSAGETAAGD